MSVYVVAQLDFIDRSAYQRYQNRFMDVMKRFRGRLLAADEDPDVLEGSWPHEKIVLLEFPDDGAFREWSESDEYQKILLDRKAGARACVLLAKGIGSAASGSQANARTQ